MQFDKKRKKNICEPIEPCGYPQELSPLIHADEILDDYLLKTRRLWVVGEINELMTTNICGYLQMFSLTNDPIYMYINSPGGCVSSGYAIVDQMLACKCPIYTIVRGQAHSMGAIIAAFGKGGHRYASPNSSMMLHSMIIHTVPDTIDKHMNMMNFANNDYRSKVAALARRMNTTTNQLLSLMEETRWMSPHQAIKAGLIDSIWTPKLERSLSKRKNNDEN